MTVPLARAALDLSARGWHVLPIKPGAKTPATTHGVKDASCDPAMISHWWTVNPECGIGVACGPSGLVVVDVDGDDGRASWAELIARYGEAKTLIAITGRGFHLYFQAPTAQIKNRARILPGIDVRSSGGYVIAPPSKHPDGHEYAWKAPGSPQSMPAWLVALLSQEATRAIVAPRMAQSDGETAYGARALDAECDALAATAEGARNAATNRAAFKIGQLVGGGQIKAATAETAIVAAAASSGLPDREIRKTVKSGLEAGMQVPRAPKPKLRVVDTTDHGTEPGWRDQLSVTINSTTGETRVKSTLANATVFLRNHPALQGIFAFDERNQHTIFHRPPPWQRPKPGALTDQDVTALVVWLDQAEGCVLSWDNAARAVDLVARDARFDPVRTYLDKLEWDGNQRIDAWLSTYLGSDVGDYYSSVGRAWLVSAVARVYQPGCKADHLLVLEGEQGRGKSRSLAALGGQWYAELSLAPAERDGAMALHGPWLVEWAELSGLSRRETEATKAFLTRSTDRIRQPYQRSMVEIPRRCVIAGTTNECTYQADPTGGRRYWPVKVTSCNPSQIERDRDQLWAEARDAYHAGAQWWLSQPDELVARDEQEERYAIHPWEARIACCLDMPEVRAEGYVMMDQIIRWLDIPVGQQHAGTTRTIANVLVRLGWVMSRKWNGSRKLRVWSKRGED